jgi:hypothetical protein
VAPTVHHIAREQAELVASAFLDAPRTSTDPLVLAAYDQLAAQADEWFALLAGPRAATPIRIVHTRTPEPYASGQELAERVRADHVLELSPARPHPLLDTSPGGAYDRFRAVHDLVSHAWLGHGFDRHGELSGWLVEDRGYRGLARWALATELHAEHSVRWTTGDVADHKATLLAPWILRASRRPSGRHLAGCERGQGRSRARAPWAHERE